MPDNPLIPEHCIEFTDGSTCKGAVEFRMALSATGKSYPRCDHHWELRLDEEERIRSRYPDLPPADFDYLDAGEYWDEY